MKAQEAGAILTSYLSDISPRVIGIIDALA